MNTHFLSTSWARRWMLAAGCLLGAGAASQVQATGIPAAPRTSITPLHGASTTAPVNDECAGAIAMTVNGTCMSITGTTVAATQSIAPVPGNLTGGISCAMGPVGNADDDVWYKFVATATSQAINVTTSDANFDAVVDVRSGTCSSTPGTTTTTIACADDNGSGQGEYVVATGLMVGSTYYVRIYSFSGNGAQGTFGGCVTPAPNCVAPTSVTVGNIAGNTATVSFVPAASGVTGYTVTYTPAGGTPTTVTATTTPVNLTGLSIGTTYNVTVASNCTSGGTSNPVTASFTTSGVANDDCTTATTLIPGVTCNPTNGTTVGANQSLAPITCAGFTSMYANDVWYKFVAVSTIATVTVVPGFDAVLDVRSGLCPGTNIGCSDNIGSGVAGTETVNLTGLIVGNTYYARVYVYGSTTGGTFTICVTGAPCPAPTALTVTNVTATSATVSFTPPAQNATNYTLTYSPANGAIQTQTVTASPITLTNLTPGSVYTLSLVSNCSSTQSSGPVTATFTTLAACPAVTSLTATNVTATSATLTFTPATGVANYTVTYTPAGGTPQTQTATGSPVTLNGLTPGKGYTVSVVSNCTGPTTGATSVAVTTNFTTPSVCLPVSGLTATSITSNSVTLTFTAAPTGTSYTILYSTAGGATQTMSAANSPVTLTGLLAGKLYTINVISTCGTSQTSVAATITFTTAAAPPTNLAVPAATLTPTSAGVTFTPPTGAVAYTITYTATNSSGTTTGVGSPTGLTGLLPSTTYTVTVVATYPGGGQSSPVTITFTTPALLSARSALAGGQVLVFPNPAHTAFTVALPALGTARTATLELLNTLGQRVRQQTLSLSAGGTQAPVDASGLPAGIYLLRVQAGSETAVTRVVIE